MRAVAPQIISPPASKNQTGNSAAGPAGRARGGPGHRPPFLVEHPVNHEVGQGQVEDPGHLARVGGQGGAALEGADHPG